MDIVDGNGVEEVQLFPSPPLHREKVGVLEQLKMLSDRLPGHPQALAEFPQRLAIPGVEPIDQLAPPRVGQRLKDPVELLGRHRCL